MSLRLAPAVAATLSLFLVGACAASAAPSTPAAPATTPTPTPVTWPSVGPTPRPTPDAGNVDGASYPVLSVEEIDAATIRVTLDDPLAKAWRVVVAGTGSLADDRFEITVETGDVAPVVTGTEIRGGDVVDVIDLTPFATGQGAAGGCHATLHVCIDSGGFRLPADGDGRFSLRLGVPDVAAPVTITGATAGWPGEPFILGEWSETQAFAWSPG